MVWFPLKVGSAEVCSMEQALRWLQAYVDMAEDLPFGFLAVDRDGRILAANSLLWRACSCASLDDFLAYAQGSASRLLERAPDLRRCRILARDGRVLFAEDRSCPLRDGVVAHYLTFDEEEGLGSPQSRQKAAYIQTHIDEAVAKGWLRIHVQPVIRAMTEKVCSVEVLSRWVDPVYGTIPPCEFVPALEEKDLSYKLARFVLEEAGSMIRRYIDAGGPVVPVSINFSRRDFETIDPFAEVEGMVLRYGIPRSMVCIEITESSVMEDPVTIGKAIDRFHQAGYGVWMDDFGSAYSSLNALKDFGFDEIKLDKAFLRDLNDKGREIITSCIQMARHLHIHTVCEGVETPEQAQFLLDAGCEKLQGFLYARPLAPDDLARHLTEHGIGVESPDERILHDATGLMPFDVHASWAVLEWDGKDQYRFVYCSRQLRENAGKRGFDDFARGRFLRPDKPGYPQKICSLVRNADEGGKDAMITYFSAGHFFAILAKVLTANQGSRLCAIKLRDTTEESRQLLLARADGITQSLAGLCDAIYLYDRRRGELQVVTSELPVEQTGQIIRLDRNLARSSLYWKDEERYWRWLEAMQEKDGPTLGVFRFQKKDGTYAWKRLAAIPYALAREEGFGDYVICSSPFPYVEDGTLRLVDPAFPPEFVADGAKVPDPLSEEVRLSYLRGSLRDQDVLKIFWKDRQRRFFAASRAFLRYYGLPSEEPLLGKTDEEIGWNLTMTEFRETEERVLAGAVSPYEIGTTIVNGMPHDIVATKFPIIHGGKIVGLAGVFFEVEELGRVLGEAGSQEGTDARTGCLAVTTWSASLVKLENDFLSSHEPYFVGMAVMEEYDRMFRHYGRETAEQMAGIAAAALKECLGGEVLLARGDLHTFLIAARAECGLREGLEEARRRLSREVWLDRCHSRITLCCGIASRASCGDVAETIARAMQEARKAANGNT